MSERLKLKQAILDYETADANVQRAMEVVDRCYAEITSVEAELEKLKQQESIRAKTRLARLKRAQQDGEASDALNDDTRRVFDLETELHNHKLTLAYAEAEFADACGVRHDAATRRHEAALTVINHDAKELVEKARQAEATAAEYRSMLLSLDASSVPNPSGTVLRLGQHIGKHLFAYFHDVSPFTRAQRDSDLMDAWAAYFQRLLTSHQAAPVAASEGPKQIPENRQREAV